MSAQLQALVEAWDPTGSADLPDEVAVALDDDPAFRAWFDARFTRWVPPGEAPVPVGLAERVLPAEEPTFANQPPMAALGSPAPRRKSANRGWIWGIAGLGAVAAAALLAVTAVSGGALVLQSRPTVVDGTYDLKHDAPRAGASGGERLLVKDTEAAQAPAAALAPTARFPPVTFGVDGDKHAVDERQAAPEVQHAREGLGAAAVNGGVSADRPAEVVASLDVRDQRLSGEFLNSVPTGRSYQSVVGEVAGVSTGSGGNPNVAGGTYTLDGLGVSDGQGLAEAPEAEGDVIAFGRSRPREPAGSRRPSNEATEDLADAPSRSKEAVVNASRESRPAKGKDGKLSRPAAPREPSHKPVEQPMGALPTPVAIAVPITVPPAVVGVQPRMSESLSVTRADYPGFVRTAQDGLSTFSIDVDTASYTQVRRTLNEGYLPPTDAVRLEELINYFPYHYAAPPAGEPFAVAVEGAPAPWAGGTDLVRIGVQAKTVTSRQPCHLTFLVDVSGSMSGPDRLGLVQSALKMLVSGLGDGDSVALVVYAGSSGVVLQPTELRHKDQIVAAIDRLQAGGSTAMGEGIELAYKLADQTYVRGSVNRVIIASDGDANVGMTDTAALSEMISRYARKGITLTTLGFGSGNYRDTRMEQLANDGDGNYFYIDSEKEAKRVLVEKLTSTLEVVAKDVKLQVDWNPKTVRKYRLLGYENRNIADRDFRVDSVDAGEIGAGHQVTAIYEVERVPDARGDLFVMRVRSKAPGPESPAVERRFNGTVEAMRPSIDQTSKDFRVAVGAALFGERLRGSPFAPGYSYADITRLLKGAHSGPEDAELVGLVERARQLTVEGQPSCRDIAYEDDDGQLVRRRIDRNGSRCD